MFNKIIKKIVEIYAKRKSAKLTARIGRDLASIDAWLRRAGYERAARRAIRKDIAKGINIFAEKDGDK